jgi:hypothetical protein
MQINNCYKYALITMVCILLTITCYFYFKFEAIFWPILLSGSISSGCIPKKDKAKPDVTQNYQPFLNSQKRLIVVLLPVIILTQMQKISILSPPNAILLIKKQYGIKVSPGTIYPVFCKLEKDGYISKHGNKYYTLTIKGNEALAEFRENAKEINLNDIIDGI